MVNERSYATTGRRKLPSQPMVHRTIRGRIFSQWLSVVSNRPYRAIDPLPGATHFTDSLQPAIMQDMPRQFRPLHPLLQTILAAACLAWLFPVPWDHSHRLGSVRKAHETAVCKVQVTPHFRFYDLRYTALTRMAVAGIDVPAPRELAGHGQIEMTMHYVHLTPRAQESCPQEARGVVPRDSDLLRTK